MFVYRACLQRLDNRNKTTKKEISYMATYTHEDLKPRSKYIVTEVNGHIRVRDIDDWAWSWVEKYESDRYYDTYEEAEDFYRRTNAEGDKIIEDVYDEGEDSEYVEEDDRGYPVFYIEYVFDEIEETEVQGLEEGDSFNGDTFEALENQVARQ